MLLGVDPYFILDQLLQFRIKLVPGAQVYGQVHQIDRLVYRHHPRRSEQDIVCDLGETEFVVHRRANVIRRIDGALFQRRENIRARQADGRHTKLLEHFGHHSARHTDFHAFEVIKAADRLLGVDDVGIMLNRPDVKETKFFVDLAGFLEHAQ